MKKKVSIFAKLEPLWVKKSILLFAMLLISCRSNTESNKGLKNRIEFVKNEKTRVGFSDIRGKQVPANIPFKDQDGNTVTLQQFLMQGRPILLTPNFYHCAVFCPLELETLSNSLAKLPFELGNQLQIVTFSFDPTDSFKLAKQKQESYLEKFQKTGGKSKKSGWVFLTGEEENIKKFLDGLEYSVIYNESQRQYEHPGIVYVLTPDAKVSQILSVQAQQDPTTLRLAFVEASSGKIGSFFDQLFTYCGTYNPQSGKYTANIYFVLFISGLVTMLVLGIMLFRYWRKELVLRKKLKEI